MNWERILMVSLLGWRCGDFIFYYFIFILERESACKQGKGVKGKGSENLKRIPVGRRAKEEQARITRSLPTQDGTQHGA